MTTTMRLRQVCLVAHDLAEAEDALCSIFGLNVGARSAGVEAFGLDNFLAPIGGDFLEVVAPTEAGTSAGRFLDRRGGDGGYMPIFQCDDGMASRQHIDGLGVQSVWSVEREGYVSTHYHPRDWNGCIPAICSVTGGLRGEEMSDWPPAHDDWRPHVRQDVTEAIVGVEMQVNEPKGAAEAWAERLQAPLRQSGDATYVLDFDNAELRFVPVIDGRGEGLGGIDLKINDIGHVTAEAAKRRIMPVNNIIIVCGTRFRLV